MSMRSMRFRAAIFHLVLMFCVFNVQLCYADNIEQNAKPKVVTPDLLKWRNFDAFPPGIQVAVISGSPRSDGPFMIRLKIPPYYKAAPNWQTVTVYVTVLSGSYHIGVGDVFNMKKGRVIKNSSAVIIPKNTHHYFWSTSGALLQVTGVGPWDIHYVKTTDDPRVNN